VTAGDLGKDISKMRKGFALAVLASVASLVTACGVRSSLEGDLEASAEPAASPFDGGAPEASARADAGTKHDAHDAAPDVALPATDLGDILLTSGRYASGTVQAFKAEAQFVPRVADTGCAIYLADSSGTCTIEVCSGKMYPLASAGALEVTGGTYPLALAQGKGGVYSPLADRDASDAGDAGDAGLPSLWLGGEELTVTATGDVVPPFAARVVTPSEIMIQTPRPERLLRQAPFAISWLGASAGDVVVDIEQPSAQPPFYFECRFDVGAGVAVVPTEALGLLPPGPATLSISTENRGSVVAGSWLVKTFARTHAADLEGHEYAEPVTLE
jgi:hypothetical protein